MNKNIFQSLKFWLIVVALSAAVILILNIKNKNNSQNTQKRTVVVSQKLPEGVSFKVLDTENLPSGFPPELVPYEKIIISQSNINQTPGNTHLYVQYIAPEEGLLVLKTYTESLKLKDWKFISAGQNGTSTLYSQFVKNKNIATITILKNSTTSQVSVDYVIPQK